MCRAYASHAIGPVQSFCHVDCWDVFAAPNAFQLNKDDMLFL